MWHEEKTPNKFIPPKKKSIASSKFLFGAPPAKKTPKISRVVEVMLFAESGYHRERATYSFPVGARKKPKWTAKVGLYDDEQKGSE